MVFVSFWIFHVVLILFSLFHVPLELRIMAEDFLVSIGVSERFLSYQKTIFDVQPRNYKFKVKLLSFPVVKEPCLFFKDRSYSSI